MYSKQSSLFSFYALPSVGKPRVALVHWLASIAFNVHYENSKENNQYGSRVSRSYSPESKALSYLKK